MDALLKILKESTIRFSGTLTARVLSYVLLMILTRLLAPGEYGTFVLAQSVISISLILALFGTPKALDRFIPYYNAAGEEGKAKTLIFTTLRVALILSVLAGLLLLVVSESLSRSLLKNPGLAQVLRIMLLTLPALAFSELVSFAFIGFKELRYPVYIQQLAAPLLMTVLAGVALVRHHGLIGWTWIYSTSVLAGALFALWLFRRHIASRLSKVSGAPISFKEIVSYSWPLSISSIVALALGQVGILFLGYFHPSAEVGIYRVYVAVALLLRLISQSIVPIYKPVISEMISDGRVEEVRGTYVRLAKWTFLVGASILLVLFLFGERIVALVFTERYVAAPIALLIMASGHFVDCSFGLKATTLEAFAHTRLFMANTLIMLGTAVGLCWLLVPQHGMVGAAIATAGATVLGGLAGLVQIYLLHGVQPFNLQYLRYASVVSVAGCVTYILGLSVDPAGAAGLLGSILLLIALYAAGLRFSRSLDSVDYQVLDHIRARITGMRETG